ncbi:hypothetical protein SASPL_145872 [Salvia splendens]|uniref:Uncharacterized protein n=1 Tax=Salvia splendens TaxID=180675 RepID=A0A8X8Z815_SALSN|nr:hypothetical protein SASPL_145872 [Salvia splendens]
MHGYTNEIPLEDLLNGTSARTRPMSYDEIMLRRKKKGDPAQQVVSSSSGAADSELAQDNRERASDIPEYLMIQNHWKDSESCKQDRVSKRSRVKSEIVKEQPRNEERLVDRKRKPDDRKGKAVILIMSIRKET